MNENEIKELKKIWALRTDEDAPIMAEEQKGYPDPATIMMVVPKTTRTRDTIRTIFEVEDRDAPKLEYSGNTGTYSMNYIKMILKFLVQSDEETVKLSVLKDYPLTLETEKLRIVLAPRCED